MDSVDSDILNILQKDAKTSNTNIAKELGMVPSAIFERIRKLEERGVIQQYRTIIKPECVDLNVIAFVMIESATTNWSAQCKEKLTAIPHVEEVHEIMGDYSYYIKIRAKDMDQLSNILKVEVGSIPDVRSTRSIMVIKTLKEYAPYPIPEPTKRKGKKKNK